MQTVHCPNCGSLAERHFAQSSQSVQTNFNGHENNFYVMKTVCKTCDYFLSLCLKSGTVTESSMPIYRQSRQNQRIMINK